MYQNWFFACFVGLATWAYLAGKEWKTLGPGKAIGLGLLQTLIATAILTIGFLLEPRLLPILGIEGGAPAMPEGGEIATAIFSALVPAGVVLVAAREGKDRGSRIRNAMATAVLALMLLDIFWSFFGRRPVEQFMFSLFSDAIGGAIAGLIIGLAIEATRRPHVTVT